MSRKNQERSEAHEEMEARRHRKEAEKASTRERTVLVCGGPREGGREGGREREGARGRKRGTVGGRERGRERGTVGRRDLLVC